MIDNFLNHPGITYVPPQPAASKIPNRKKAPCNVEEDYARNANKYSRVIDAAKILNMTESGVRGLITRKKLKSFFIKKCGERGYHIIPVSDLRSYLENRPNIKTKAELESLGYISSKEVSVLSGKSQTSVMRTARIIFKAVRKFRVPITSSTGVNGMRSSTYFTKEEVKTLLSHWGK